MCPLLSMNPNITTTTTKHSFFLTLSSMFLCCRYRRKGSSSLGLDPRFQAITWEESEQSAKKKKKADVKRRKAERYFSKDSQQLLRSEPALPSLPRIGAGNDAPRMINFITLAGGEGVGRGETGRIQFGHKQWNVKRICTKQASWVWFILNWYYRYEKHMKVTKQ